VEDQRAYYDRATARDRRELEKQVVIINSLNVFLLALLILWLLRPLFGGVQAGAFPQLDLLLKKFKDHGATVVVVSAVALTWIAEMMALPEQVRRYFRMSSNLTSVMQDLEECLKRKDLDGARKQLRKLGRDTLWENGEWVLLNRERPMLRPAV
jgi:hypothetical protein